MRILIIASILATLLTVSANAATPERTVSANSIISKRGPQLRVNVPKAAGYVGGDRWNLYDVADCEIHVFVEADKNRQVTRIYWVQFEAYLPAFPNYHYDYPSPPNTPMRFWNLDFQVRARFGPTAEPAKQGSDL